MSLKNIFSHPRNILIIFVIELLFIINPINSEYDLCIQHEMKGYYLNSTTFKQYGGNNPYIPYYYYNYYFLKKHYYFHPYEYARDCYGNLYEKIDFKRNFHMGFRSYPVNAGCCKYGVNYGLAIVLGEYEADSYKIYNDGPEFLIQGLDKSIVILLRYSDHSVVIVDCLKQECNIYDENNPIGYYNQISPYNNLYLHIVYRASEHSIEVYYNEYDIQSNFIVSYDQVYLTDYLSDRGRGYLGITATDYYGPFFHDLYGTYYCINGGEKIVPTVSLNYEKEIIYNNQTIIVPPSATLNLVVKYNTIRERELMGKGNITVNGTEYLEPPSIDEATYTFNYYASSVYDNYILIYSTDYDDFIFKIIVQSSKINKLNYAYGESPDDKDKAKIINDIRVLKYGSLNGDFDFSEYENKYLYFHVIPEDDYGHETGIKEIEEIRSALINDLKYQITLDKVEGSEKIYRIGIPIKNKGVYLLSSTLFNNSIYFNVINLIPDKTKSSCIIEDYEQNYVYDRNEEVKFTCEFRDDISEINIEDSQFFKNLTIKTYLKRNDVVIEEINGICSGSKCNYKYTTGFNGKYKFVTEFGFKDMETIDSNQNTFNVAPKPLTLAGCYFYNPDIDLFIHIDSIENTVFNYYEDKEDKDQLLLIDLVDSNGKEVTRYSDIENSYANFDPDEIKGKIVQNHSEYEGLITFTETTFNEKKYILVKLDGKNPEMKRSSLPYFINLDFSIKQDLKVNYDLPDLNGYIACGKDLEIENSIVKTINTNIIKSGSSAIISQLVLRTDEEHLHNYFLNDTLEINFIEEKYNCIENKTCEIKPLKSTIEGIYNLEFISYKAGNFKVIVQIDGKNIKDGQNTFDVNVEPIYEAYYLEPFSSYEKKYTIGVDNVKLGFIIKDVYGNPIDADLNSDKFGLLYDITINGVEPGTNSIKLVKETDAYYIEESETVPGNYVITLRTKYSNKIIEYTYYKGPGKAYASSSSLIVTNSNKLNLHEEAKAEIFLFDSFGNSINADSEAYNREVQYVEIYALSGNGINQIRVNYTRDINNKFITEPLNITGTYIIYGKINDDKLICLSPLFEVVDYGYDFSLSQLKMIGDTITLMQKGEHYTLYEGLQRPAFEFDFMTENGLPSNEMDNTTIIQATIINSTNEPEILENIWIDINKILWVLPDTYKLSKGDYLFKVANNNTEYNYYISIVEYGEDASNKDYDISNTFVSPNILYLKAGVSGSFIVELRDRYNLRYNQTLDTKLFEYTASGLQIIPKRGTKNGQIIVEVKSENICDFSEKCKISMIYEHKNIPTEVQIVVSAGELYRFLVDSSDIVDKENNILYSGTAGTPQKINLIPYDRYNNIIKDSIFDKKVYPEESFSKLFNLRNENSDYSPSLTSSTNPVSYYIELSFFSEKVGTLTLSSIYFGNNVYTMKINPGKPSKYSTGYLDGEPGNTSAGKPSIFVIEPKDENGNIITDRTVIDSITDKFSIKIYDLYGKDTKDEITGEYKEDKNRFEYIIKNKKAQTKVVKAYYKDEEIILNNNVIYVVSGYADLDYSILKYNGQQFNINETLNISLATLPIIDLQLNDEYGNNVDILPILNNIDFYLVKGDNKLSKIIPYNKDLRLYINELKADDYFNINKLQKDCKMILRFNGTEKEINIEFLDEPPTEDKDKPVSFIMDTDDLLLKAGENGTVSLVFYTEKGKPMGYYFNPISQISLSCNSEREIKSEVLLGKNYGTYNIIITSIYDVETTCTVKAIEKIQNFTLKVIPNKVNKCEFSSDSLPNAIAGELYEVNFLCYDEYGNYAYLGDGEFGTLITDKDGEKVEYDINLEDENKYSLYILPKKSGIYKIKSNYFLENTFVTLPGEISPENSYLEIQESAKAGNEIEINIHVLDKFGNKVALEQSHKSIFDLYYRYQEDSTYSKYEKITFTPEIDENILRYKKEVNKGGFNEFRGIHHETSYIIKCKNCEIEVIPGEFNLEKSDVYKFNSFSKTYTKLSKFNDVLYNYEEDLLIKIYPKDIYGNKISGENLNINVKIDEITLNKVSSNKEFIEFEETSGIFKELNGEKELVIYYGDNNISYSIYIAGKGDFDDNVDPLNTKLLETNLEFKAGQSGYFIFELRNSKNVRYSGIFTGEISLNPAGPNVNCDIYNRYSSVILVVVKSIKANTFPNIRDSNLAVSVMSEKVFDLNLIIHPANLYTAELFSSNLIDMTITIKADNELRFSIIGKDFYGNLLIIDTNEAKLKVINKNNQNEMPYKESYTDISNGEQKYVYDLTQEGTYEITSGTNDKKEDLFNNTVYTVEVEAGELSPEKTIVKIDSSIIAGNKAIATISPKDKYNNNVTVDDILLGKFYSYILSNKYDFIIPSQEKVEKAFKYEKLLDKIGTYQYNINYNGKKLKSQKLVVYPSECTPENTLIYTKDKNGKFVIYNNETNAYSSVNSPLSLHLVFRDVYHNIITDIKGINIVNAYLHGNNMKELYWTYSNGELNLNLLSPDNKKILEHLVTRIGKDCYTFTFEVEYNNQKAAFNLKVNHFSKKENEKDYGNGDYVLDKCNVSTKVAEFTAGTTYEVLLYLRTEDELLYNGDFNINFIDCQELTKEDKSFKCTVSKKNTSIYSINYYSTTHKDEKDDVHNIIKLYNSDYTNFTKFDILLLNTNGIPSKKYTNITQKLPDKIKEDSSNAIIKFTLKDEFGNALGSKIKNNLSFENHGNFIDSKIDFDEINKEFTASLKIIYPPKDISIQLFYKLDDNNKIDLFKDTQKSVFELTVEYSKTVINSKNINRMKAGEFLDLNIITYDKNSQCYIDGDLSGSFYVTVQGPLEKTIEKRTFHFKKDNGTICEKIYKIIMDESNYYVVAGTYSIVVYVNDVSYSVYTQNVISGDIYEDNFIIYYTDLDEKSYTQDEIPAGETIYFMVQAYDKFKNKIDHETLPPDSFVIKVTPNITENKIVKYSGGSGALRCQFHTTKIGTYKFEYEYNKRSINANTDKGPKQITYVSGECSAENPRVVFPSINETEVSTIFEYIIICLDKYGNEVTKGGAKFTSKITLFIEESQNKIEIESKIDDKKNGTYIISFIPPLLGGYSLYTYLDGNIYSELEFNLTEKEHDWNYTCPNNIKMHVNDLRDCIPDKNRCNNSEEKDDKPFRCDDSTECVDSMTKCDAPKGAKKCIYMSALYPEGKEYLCSYSLPLDCKRKYPSYRIICDDGICRSNKNLQPNQRVCPIGKVLCADLTCKDSVDECYNDWPECGNTQIRCPDQSCVDDQKNCPTTITCSNPNDFVCPDGTCVVNEIYCSRLKTCPDEIPYLCSDNSCATKPENCPHTVACGHGKSLCSDLICRDKC